MPGRSLRVEEPDVSEAYPRPRAHYAALDALRFALALWVAVGHLGPFPFFGEKHLEGFERLFVRGVNSLTWGPPAVMGFFVISGFCIHYPSMSGRKLPVLAFYGRRYVRILIPVAASILLMRLISGGVKLWGRDSVLWDSPLWSLLCEEIYYAIYPAVRWVRERTGWTPVLAIATAPEPLYFYSLFCAVLRSWPDIGPIALTAATLYPVWLLGCVLAEQAGQIPAIDSPKRLWGWRSAAWSAGFIAEMLNFHGHIFLTVTLAPYGVLAYFWIRNEIACHKHHSPPELLCRAGSWSYSLYLIHPVAGLFVLEYLPFARPTTRTGWVVSGVLMLAFSYVFYLLVERPSHRLARRIQVA